MNTHVKRLLAAAMSVGLLYAPMATAAPAPAIQAVPGERATTADLHQVQHRPNRHGHGHRPNYRPHHRPHHHHAPQTHRPRYSQAHVHWCYNRYRSYRVWDNTFQPYHGPRRACRSPYL